MATLTNQPIGQPIGLHFPRTRSGEVSVENLKKIYVFSSLDPGQLEVVHRSMRQHKLDVNENLFDDQHKADRFFYLRRGQIKLSRISASGGEKVVEIVQPGNVFALAVLFMEEPNYPVCADAVRPSEVFSFDGHAFLDILRSSTDTCFRVMADMSNRLRRQMGEIDNLCLQSASFRMIQYLLDQVPNQQSKGVEIFLDAPKNLIASRLSIQPETLSRILRTLTRKNLIIVDNKTISIPDVTKLREYLDAGELCRGREK
ncbi:MAG: Crp/Fnr family transcriptional regulator [Magnetococcales bacterium]|nr:Crp/Fnr family transcriptional regulator [Magnetococcales bacterium]NGZ29083.1 Crp/Fnr family transcriptional regulator [Magnetococcales bacterium]